MDTFGNVSLAMSSRPSSATHNYVTLTNAGHDQKVTGLENRGFFGMGLKQGMTYRFSTTTA